MEKLLRKKYGLDVVAKNLIQQLEDDVYLLKDSNEKKYKFKVFKNLTINRENEIKQIYEWTTFLSARLPMPFSKIIPTKDGDEFIKISKTDNTKGCLFEWIDWEIIDGFNEDYAKQVGICLRDIHEETKPYKGNINSIKRIDSVWINQKAKILILKAAKINNLPGLVELESNIEYLSNWLSVMEEKGDFGLIHSDLHRKNVVHKGEKLGFIDYDDTIFCSFLLDIATIINEFEDYPNTEDLLQESLLKGYGIRKDSQLESDLYLYGKIADMIYAEWIFGDREGGSTLNPSKIQYGIDAIKSLIELNTAANTGHDVHAPEVARHIANR